MLAIVSLISVIVLSMVIVRVATVALTLTGVSSEMARFQARSAFTGAGFTTGESEQMVCHPVRRRIIMLLMLLGNAGIVTAVSTLILSFTGAQGDGIMSSVWARILLLAVGLASLFALSHSRLVDRWMSRAIRWALVRWTSLEVRDYASLLHLGDEYVVSQLSVGPGDWLAGRTLIQLALTKEGVLILGIERSGGRFLGAPRGSTKLEVGDVLLIYGRSSSVQDLDVRPAGPSGNRAHVEAVGREKDLQRAMEADESEASAESRTERREPIGAAAADSPGPAAASRE